MTKANNKLTRSLLSITFFSLIYLILSFFLYRGIPQNNNIHRDVDSQNYVDKATLFYKEGVFFEGKKPPLVQQPIGYPLFIGTIYKMFGTKNSNPPTSDAVLIWIQILLTIFSGILLFFAAKHIFGQNIALITHALFMLNLGTIVFAQFILAETLLTFFLILFLERFLYFLKHILYKDTFLNHALISACFALGLSVLVKPAALYYIFVVAIFLVPFFINSNAFLKQSAFIKNAIPKMLFLIAFFAPIKLYKFYNSYNMTNSHKAIHFDSLKNYNLYVWFWSKIKTDQKKPPKGITFHAGTIRNEIFGKEKEKCTMMIDGNPLKPESWQKLKKAFWKDFYARPYIFVKTWIREMIKTFAGLYTTNLKVLVEPETNGGDVSFFFTQGSIFEKIISYITAGTTKPIVKTIGFVETFWNLIRYLFVLIGLLWLLFSRSKNLFPRLYLFLFFSSYLSYFSFVTGFDGCARYRTMIEFLLLMLAALGIFVCFNTFKKIYKKGITFDERHQRSQKRKSLARKSTTE